MCTPLIALCGYVCVGMGVRVRECACMYAVCAGVCVCLHDCGIAWYMCNAINFHHKVHDHNIMWSNI